MKRGACLSLLALAACSGGAETLTVDDFALLDLPWPVYCDFYKDEASQAAGRAVFASQFNSPNPAYIMRINGEFRTFSDRTQHKQGQTSVWAFKDDDYALELDLNNKSDVPEIQTYTGQLRLVQGSQAQTFSIIGRCSA